MDTGSIDFEDIKQAIEHIRFTITDPSESLDRTFRYLALKRIKVKDIHSVFKVLEEFGIIFYAKNMTTKTIEELYEPYTKYVSTI